MIFPGGMNKITSHQLHEKFSDLKLVWRELPIDNNSASKAGVGIYYIGGREWESRRSTQAGAQLLGLISVKHSGNDQGNSVLGQENRGRMTQQS